ncbi:MAG TPA: glycosyltransferase [Elusimicrobiales bacterium]|nr:glycosyltransferase [Elusimicrobiales bacterium]
MKILIITRSYFPDINPYAFRFKAVAEYLVKQGHSVDIFTSHIPKTPKKETINNVKIFRHGSEKIKHCLNPKHLPSNKNDFRFKTIIRKTIRDMIRFAVKLFIWPDFAAFWAMYSYKELKNIVRENSYNAVISVCLPFSDHLLALKIKKYVPNAVWIADVQDPFYLSENFRYNNTLLYKKLNYAFERKVFKTADYITVTFKNTAKEYQSIFPENSDKIKIIPHLVDLQMPDITQKNYFDSSDKIRLIYIGTLEKKMRNPSYLLKLFTGLLKVYGQSNLELHFFGNINDCTFIFNRYKNLLDKKIFVHGIVSRDTIGNVMSSADFLVNMGNKSTYLLPSKIVEYVAFQKPIINLSVIADDTSAEFLRPYPIAINLLIGTQTIEEQVSKLVKFIKSPPKIEDTKKTSDWIDTFKINSVGSKYEGLILDGKRKK